MNDSSSKVILKSVGKSYEVEWNPAERTVKIIKGRKKLLFNFRSFCESVDFYAGLKSVKDVKNSILLAEALYGAKFSTKS